MTVESVDWLQRCVRRSIACATGEQPAERAIPLNSGKGFRADKITNEQLGAYIKFQSL
jgi:hypothetical protein